MNQDVQKQMPTTHWSLVKRAGMADADAQRQALGDLLRRYWPALKGYLIAIRRMGEDAAEEALQGFISEKVIEQELFSHADQGKGRFRNFLLASLNNYVVAQWRKEKETEPLMREVVDEAAGPDEEFDAAWARSLLAEVLRRMEEQCKGREAVWAIFKARVLPEMLGRPPAGYETLVVELGLSDPRQAANLLVTAKRLYVRILREVVGEYEGPSASIEEELADLRNALSKGGAG